MSRQVSRRLLLLLAVLALAATGAVCGDDGGGGGGLGPAGAGRQDGGDGGDDGDAGDAAPAVGGASDIDACELVTQADAEELLGGPVTKADSGSAPGIGGATCNWEIEDETSFQLLQFSVYEGKQFYGGELFKDDPNYEKVDGVGDDAFFTEPLGVQLQILVDDYSVLIDVSGFNTDSPLDKEKVKEQLITLGKRIASDLS